MNKFINWLAKINGTGSNARRWEDDIKACFYLAIVLSILIVGFSYCAGVYSR